MTAKMDVAYNCHLGRVFGIRKAKILTQIIVAQNKNIEAHTSSETYSATFSRFIFNTLNKTILIS